MIKILCKNILKSIIIIVLTFIILGCAKENAMLIVGDSIFSGYSLNEDEVPVNLIKKTVHKETIEFCEPGLTLSAFSNRLTNYDNINISHVIIELGANDFLLNKDIENTKKAFFKIMNYFSNKSSNICLVSFVDSEMFSYVDYCDINLLHQYEEMYKSFQDNNVIIVTNIWENTFLKSEYKIDFFHPNKRGAELITRNIVKQLQKYAFF